MENLVDLRINVLVVCSRNKWRSRTAETIFKNDNSIFLKSAGTSNSAERRVTKDLIDWAELIYVMEDKHKAIIETKFGKGIKPIIVLNIPDEYQYMDEELIQELESSIKPNRDML